MITNHRTDNHNDDQLLSNKEMLLAIELLFHRMDSIHNACANEFPLYSLENHNQWILSPGGSWVGGLWGACWWLRSKVTGSTTAQHKASAICHRLASKIETDSGFRSLVFWYGASLGATWFCDEHAKTLTQASCAVLAKSFDPTLNCIPLGTAMGGGKEGNHRFTIDNFASLIQLLGNSQQEEHEYIARQHADTILAICRQKNGAFHSSAYFNGKSFQSIEHAGAWSRGQAWAMLGLARAAEQWGTPYLTYAQTACEYWLNSRPDLLPSDRLDRPSSPCDPSAAVIASLAMLSLARLTSEENSLRVCAHRQITAIIRSQYFTGMPPEHNGSINRKNDIPGIFWGCWYKTGKDKEAWVESVWGSFFLMATLCVLVDLIEPNHL